MSVLQISVAPGSGVEVPENAVPVFVDAVYPRTIEGTPSEGVADLPGTVQETLRFALNNRLRGSCQVVDVAPGSRIDLAFLAASNAVRLTKSVRAGDGAAVSLTLDKDDVAAITAQDPQPDRPTPRIERRAYFVPSGDARVPFEASTLQIAPVTVGQGGWSGLALDRLFLSDVPLTSAVPWPLAGWSHSGVLPWTSTHVTVDGQFAFALDKGAGDAWMWWLTGPFPAIGIVLDDLSAARVIRIGVPLPPFTDGAPAGEAPQHVPVDVTETEVAGNPGIYSEDPGEFCRPFTNPERVLGERSFFVIVRAEQPVISAEASVVVDPLPTLGFDVVAGNTGMASPMIARTVGTAPVTPAGAVLADTPEVNFRRHALPTSYVDMLRRFNRGRTELDARNPVQWESDISRYQATTVARGHILEFRMRWRSNGYSLGSVAKTLTLAPRQVRRIQKIEWRRAEATRRQELTRFGEQASDILQRERDYDDAVQANLSEWSRGRSESSMTAGAAGVGFATAGFVIGGGGAKSHAETTASQEGGRRASASEEQRLRDSIRRYGDSLRKFESIVVTEVTQEEATTGTTEVVRNQNYAHSLTVIYYQILRHLKIETSVAGVRECLFVPFAIRPFTLARAYRWRELIRSGLRDTRHAQAIGYLKDVLSNFANSTVPAGRRSDQPIKYIHGSLFIRLAIDRPRDKDDGNFDVATWARVQPFLGSPALSIYARLKVLVEAQRDAAFQRDHAPTIGASWVNTLKFEASGVPLAADFTLATRYQFNGVVRVDFSIANPIGQQPVTRELLSSIRILATKDLPPGSVANLQSISLTYQTDQFERGITASQGSGDLVEVETGVRDTNGATAGSVPDPWERQDIRAEMIHAVQGLVEHLNDHVEYYHKVIWWNMDRDRLFMLIDGFYVPGTNGVSIASVVERDPIAIIGNAIVFRVSAGAFLGLGNITTPAELLNHYVANDAPSEPILVSLPTDGLYAQAVMDECSALEEHFGNTDWALSDPDPELGTIAPELLTSRRAEPVATQPSAFPQTLINLQNAPEAPAPSGLAGALSAVTNANAFRDMAGLAGTQANAAAGFQTAAALASSFGAQAAALRLAETADKAHATQTADQKLSTVQRAVDKNLTSPEDAQQHASKILEGLHPQPASRPDPAAVLAQPIFASASSIKATTPEYQLEALLEGGGGGTSAAGGTASKAPETGWKLDHILLESLDPATSAMVPGVITATPSALVTPFFDADASGVTPDADLQKKITDLINNKPAYRNVRSHIAVAVADLSGANKFSPKYGGFNDLANFYGASVNKITGLLGVYQLRAEANELLKSHTNITDIAGLETELKSRWTAAGIAAKHHPLVSKILAVQPGTPATTALRPELTARLDAISSGNQNGSTSIILLRFPFIASTLLAHGLFSPVNKAGIWSSKAYGPINYLGENLSLSNWSASENPFPGLWRDNVNAVSLAQFYTLAAQRRMIDEATSKAILGHLQTGGCHVEIDLNPLSANGEVATKCGSYKGWVHETVHFKETATLREFVIIILTKNHKFDVIKPLFNDLVSLIP